MAETLKAIIQAIIQVPIPTIFILAGISLLAFSAIFEIQNGTGRNKGIKIAGRKNINLPGILIGGLLIGIGLFYTTITGPAAAAAEATITATSEPVAINFVLATSTMESPISTPEPAIPQTTATEIKPATKTPLPVLTLKDGCIFASTWQAASRGISTSKNDPDANGCLALGTAGLAADNSGVLHLLQTAKKDPLAAGIYTSITDKSIIEFKVSVKNLTNVYAEKPAAINFAIIPLEDLIPAEKSARFKLLFDLREDKPLIYFVLADLGETTGSKITTQHYEYGHTYTIRLELTGISIRTYINNIQTDDTLALPAGPKAFFIGYDLPTMASADVSISDVRVDGNLK